MGAPKIMAIRMGIYALLIGYLLLDLFVFKGPLKKTLTEPQLDTEAAIAEAKAQGVVARVYYEPIYRKQVEERMKEYLWRRGRTPEETTFGERKSLRKVLLNEMIDELLVKIQIKVSPIEEYAVDEDELKQAMEIEEKRLGGTFDELANRSGWQGTEELEMRLGARIQRENYLKKKILADVSEEEARAWYEERKDEFVSPERRKVKWRSHDGGEFQEEWVDTSKLPKEIAEGVFKLSVGAQEKFGGYEIELLEIKEARSDAFEEVKELIIDALTSYQRDEGWKYFRHELLRARAKGDKVNKDKIQIFEESLIEE